MGFSVQIIAVPELAGLAAFLASRFSERGIEVSGDAAARIELSFDLALPADSCRIERSGAAVWRISGPELSAVVGGAGRFLHRSCFSRGAIWEAPAGTEIFTPL